ncbi:hypothetical protein EYF80_050583 [Liparis tanakae]|uniref:Uncharacterized protein n=1 Tax=Liparis tanakae TaxID=230148 RepID=A0A4Z2FDP0_9TELE|nr:hypothetical protein EYF80_050583 [Liparis tanakae]
MAESFYRLEDEAFPSFLCRSLDSTGGRAASGDVTLGSGPGLPVAASTVAKIKPGADNRGDPVEASYLEANSHSSAGERPKFSLNFKDDMDNVDDFIAAHRLSDMLVKIHLDESASQSRVAAPTTQTGSVLGRPAELETDLSTGLLTFAHVGRNDRSEAKFAPAEEDEEEQSEGGDSEGGDSEGGDSDHFSGSNSSFLVNEKLMCVDSMSSGTSDDDFDSNDLPDDELEQYFNDLVPPAMQRGRVEGQEIPATGLAHVTNNLSNPSSTEPDQYRHQFLDEYDQEDFQMPDVRLAATGMDSCPASDEDTEEELESARGGGGGGGARTRLLPSTSRQLVRRRTR